MRVQEDEEDGDASDPCNGRVDFRDEEQTPEDRKCLISVSLNWLFISASKFDISFLTRGK